jgi:hypothetical protein
MQSFLALKLSRRPGKKAMGPDVPSLQTLAIGWGCGGVERGDVQYLINTSFGMGSPCVSGNADSASKVFSPGKRKQYVNPLATFGLAGLDGGEGESGHRIPEGRQSGSVRSLARM